MPTLKPKRTFVYSSDDARRALEAALADRCEVNRTNMSQEIEGILIDALVPHDGGLAELAMTRIYYGQTGVRDEVSTAFCDAAAVYDWDTGTSDLRPLVELAARQSLGSLIDASREEDDGSRPVYHLATCWASVCGRLHRVCEEEPSSREALSAAVDEGVARDLSRALDAGNKGIEARAFFDIVLRNWAVLGGFTYTYRALMDVVSIADEWPETARSREDLKACLCSVAAARGGE